MISTPPRARYDARNGTCFGFRISDFGFHAKRGFTLIETLVAVTILVLAIAGPLYVANTVLVSARVSRDELIASYLAQEGVEYVRMMRDHEFLSAYLAGGSDVNSAAWDAFMNGSGAGTISSCTQQTCTLDPSRPMGTGRGLSLTPCVRACGPLYLSSGGLYTEQTTGTPTPFTRTIQATVVSGTEVKIVSQVAWSFHSIPRTVTVTDHLTSWQ